MRKGALCCVILVLTLMMIPGASWSSTKTITDQTGRTLQIPDPVDRVICSGPGALRLLVYLQAQDKAVAVDDIEKKKTRFDARPYTLTNPRFMELPLFGERRGRDNPELIVTLKPQPQVIFKTYPTMGHDPLELQKKTGIPVIILEYGDLNDNRPQFYEALRIMGEVVGKEKRAEQVIAFFESTISDLRGRVKGASEKDQPTCFVGGVAFKGPLGLQSTEPAYPPFEFVGARNIAADPALKGKALRHSNLAKEKIVQENPDFIFIDLASLQMGEGHGAIEELRADPAYQTLTAVKTGNVYGLPPYNLYTQNCGSILADAYFIGKLLRPDRFADIDPKAKADEIYTFLVGKPVFSLMDQSFDGLAFKKIPLK